MSPWPIEPSLSFVEQVALLGTYVTKLTEGREAFVYIRKIANGHTAVELSASLYSDDYIVSHAKILANSENVRNYRLPNVDPPKNTKYLDEIGALCKERRLHCVYVQGPIMAELITGKAGEDHFFSTVADKIRAAGISLVNERPFLMSEENRGDSIFHLSHDYRDAFTALYAKKIMPMLDVR
jgi:hypothetical protein